MNGIKKKLVAMVIMLFHAHQVYAYPEFSYYVNNHGVTLEISGPADRLTFGSVIMNTGSSTNKICSSSALNYNLQKVVYEPVATWSGRTYQATSAHVPIPLFESGVTGFALTPMGGNTDDGPLKNFLPLYTDSKTVWSGYTENARRITNGHRVTSGLYLYKDENRFTGTTIIPQQLMYRYLCKDGNDTTQEVYNFIFNPIIINGAVTGCTPASNAVVIDMDKIAQSKIENADSSTLIGTKQSVFSLQCDPNINVFISFVDLSDPTNTSDTATLTADSTATGVGFALTGPQGKRLVFGPDGSAIGVPGQQKYFIQNSGSAYSSRNNPISTTFGFSYVRKTDEAIKPGTAKAVIGLTYSYQ